MSSTDSTSPENQTSKIQVLSGRDAVRKRPGIYVGDDRDGQGITHMLLEVISNALEQFLAGLATHIGVQIETDDSCTVTDPQMAVRYWHQKLRQHRRNDRTWRACRWIFDGIRRCAACA